MSQANADYEEMRETICGILLSLTNNDAEPPYKREEMLVIILFVKGEKGTMARWMTAQDIVSEALRIGAYQDEWMRRGRGGLNLWNEYLCNFNMPYIVTERDRDVIYTIKVPETALWIRLRGLISEAHRSQVSYGSASRILSLPVGHRIVILDTITCRPMLACRASTNLRILSTRVQTQTRDLNTTVPLKDCWPDRSRTFIPRPIYPGSINDMLLPLHANLQLYHEAVESFYRINTFVF